MVLDVRFSNSADSFVDALHSEIVAGSGNLNSWIKRVHAEGGIDSLFRLESWLRGLRSFFDLGHIPLGGTERPDLVARDFSAEVRVVRVALQACERYACDVIRVGSVEKLEFEEFVEAQMRKDNMLDYHMGRIVEQLTPMDSLSRLLECLNDFRVLIDSFKSAPQLDYQLFLSLGRCFRRDLKNCRYIDMLLCQRFRLQYDIVENRELSALLRGIAEEQFRRNAALAFLYLFRFLKYLALVSSDMDLDRPLQSDLVLFSLLHEEISHFADFLRNRFPKGREIGPDLRSTSELMAYSLKSESQKILDRELAFVSQERDASAVRLKVETSYELLCNCCHTSIIGLAQAIDKDFDVGALFPSRAGPLLKSQELRNNLWNLRQYLVEVLENGGESDAVSIMEHIVSFMETSLRSLRYDNWEELERFSDLLAGSGGLRETRMQIRKLVRFLEDLVQEVSKHHNRPFPEMIS